MKKLRLLLCTALILAIAATFGLATPPLAEGLTMLKASQLDGLAPSLDQELPAILSLLVDYSENKPLYFQAQSALLERHRMAREILPIYGRNPAFQKILIKYGNTVLIPIDYFLKHKVYTLWFSHEVGNLYTSLFGDDTGSQNTTRNELPPTKRGLRAIHLIRSEGHQFLSEFVTAADGTSKWLYTTRTINDLTAFLFSGVTNLEGKTRSGKDVDAADFAWAAVDILPFVAAGKLLKAGRLAKAGAKEGKMAAEGAKLASPEAKVSAIEGKPAIHSAERAGKAIVAKKSAASTGEFALRAGRRLKAGTAATLKTLFRHPFATFSVASVMTAVAAVTHPSLLNSAFAAVAHAIGVPVTLLQILGWSMVLMVVLYPVSWLLRLVAPPVEYLGRGTRACMDWLDGRKSRRSRDSGMSAHAS